MNSQYGEEQILVKFFGNKRNGLVVDIGAADGSRYSNSYWLITKGWKGVLIEPNKKNFEKLQNTHKYRLESVVLINEAAGKETIKNSTIYCDRNDHHEQLSTLSSTQVEHCKKIYNCNFYEQPITVTKTSEIFEKNNILHIDFLSIDTEMLDYEVLLGIDFKKVDISLICVEHNNPELEKLMNENHYKFYDKTIGNIFYKKCM